MSLGFGADPKNKEPAIKEPGTAELLAELLEDVPVHADGSEPKILLEDLLDRFKRRSFGVFLIFVVLPSYIPIAFGIGAVSGGLSILCGLQMMLGYERPWLPKFARGFGLPRRGLSGFARRSEVWFRRLERIIKPRQSQFTTRAADRVTGLVIVIMGIALSLPIPLTNPFFAVPLTVLAFGMIERDGAVIGLCWLFCAVEVLVFALLGESAVTMVYGWF